METVSPCVFMLCDVRRTCFHLILFKLLSTSGFSPPSPYPSHSHTLFIFIHSTVLLLELRCSASAWVFRLVPELCSRHRLPPTARSPWCHAVGATLVRRGGDIRLQRSEVTSARRRNKGSPQKMCADVCSLSSRPVSGAVM